MYLFETLDPHPPTVTPILGQSPKKNGKTVKMAEWLFSLKHFFLTPSLIQFSFFFVLKPGPST